MYPYKVSVIMAVYNVESFLSEAIDSIIAQDIGFENIQLILVDDGSPDGCGAICDTYAARYPGNIVAIHKENGGVSSARNAGLDIAQGELINFMDSDDTITPETFRNVWNFYQENKLQTDVILIPMIFFDGKTGGHTLNYKFNKGTRVIDLDSEWNVCHLSVSSAFINAEKLRTVRFDENLAYAEDAHLLFRVLAHKCTMGVLKGCGSYMYRQRTTGPQSALQSATGRKSWYLDYFEFFQKDIIRYYKQSCGRIPRFVQFALMYDIQWRLRLPEIPAGILTAQEETLFLQHITDMLQEIEDEVILAQRNLFSEHKVFALKLKYGNRMIQTRDNDYVLLCGNTVASKLSQCSCRMEFLSEAPGGFLLEGRVCIYDGLQEDVCVSVKIDDRTIPCEMIATEPAGHSLGSPILYMCSFRVLIPVSDDLVQTRLSFWLCKGEKVIRLRKLTVGAFFPVSNTKYRNGYAILSGKKICFSGSTFTVNPVSGTDILLQELRFLKELWKRNGTGERKAIPARILSGILRCLHRKPLWLISDRAGVAGDNGEAFFRYLCKHHPEIDARFVISKNAPDYHRMRQIGPVLAKDTYLHKIYHLMSDFIISSHAEVDVYNPFVGYSEPYRDLLSRSKFIFLQHGISQNDLSGWLDRYKKNIRGIVAAAHPEAEAFLEYPYHYSEDHVWLTGFPRFDRLYTAQRRQITIMPTWRKYLLGTCSQDMKAWSLSNDFMTSDYLSFYNGLLNHPRLLEAAKKLDYQLAFFPHPNLQNHLDVFRRNSQVAFVGADTAYRDIYAASSLVVTDYSSAVFDFAYLRKPVIYAQFDKEQFFSGAHTLKSGYFDYSRDGFGEVTDSLEETVDLLIAYMENNCQMKEEYRRRADAFFAFNDQNNCQRVFEKLIQSN